jgi:hypothetical protein
MATQVQFRRGTTTQNNAFTGAVGEITYDTEVKTLRLHDGTSAGGGSILANLGATQTMLNKTMSTGSTWAGNVVALAYGGTNSTITAVSGAIVYSTSSSLAVSSQGTSGQVLTSGGTASPTWLNASALTVGTASVATRATNIDGGSAGYLAYQIDTNQTGFITPGQSGYVLRSTGASTAPSWVTSAVTIGSTSVQVGDTQTSFVGLTALDGTAGATSFFSTPTSPALFAAGTAVTLGATTGTLTVRNADFIHSSTAATKIAVGTTAQRPTPATGQIRYNSDLASFEGYAASAWASLGGVKSVDGFTYIIAETSAGASNGELEFYVEDVAGTAAVKAGGWDKDALTVGTDLIVTGDLTVNGTTTTVNSTVMTVDDPVITLGGDTAPVSDDNKDRGVEYNYHNGSLAKVGFFGMDDSSGEFTYIPDATNSAEVFTGTAGPVRFGATNLSTLDTSGIVNINDTTQSSAYTDGALVVDGGVGVAKDLRVEGTIYAGGDGVIAGNIAITGNLTVNGTTTTTSSANTGYGAAIISLNYVDGGIISDNGKDIGIAFDYYKSGAAKEAYLVWKNDTQVLTYFSDATISAEVVSGTIGNAKFGSLELTGDLALQGGDITTSSTGTATVFNANATTLNIGGAATTVAIGAATGTLTLNNASTVVAGDLSVNGGDILTNQATAAIFNTTATTINAFGAATSASIGAATGTLTINNASLIHNSTGATTLAAGTTAQRPGSPATGMIRYNSTLGSFEGYATAWSSLGGVKSVDGLTYITAETTAGASDDILSFVTDNVERLYINTATADFDATVTVKINNSTNATNATSGALQVIGGVGIDGALFAQGNITSAGDIISNSDERLKSEVQIIEDPLNKVKALNGVTFIKNGSTKRTAGVIAQNVLASHPEVVYENEDGMLAVSYGNMVGLLIEAIKEQQKQIDDLKAKLGN